MKIAFLFPYPLHEAASQRFRFEQYYDALTEAGIAFENFPFLDLKSWNRLYKPGNYILKFFDILKGLLKRKLLLFRLLPYDYVFIHREAAPLGPPIFEFIIAKVLRKKIIYDFDDAIWLENYSEANSNFSFLKWYSKAKSIMKWAYKNSCGNHYLCDFASQYSKCVVYNPTTIDTINYHNKIKPEPLPVFTIGWTGSHSTNRYLEEMEDVFLSLEKKYQFKLLVISDKSPEMKIKSLEFIRWQKQTEIEDLLKMDVGIMPLKNDKWANGKCGFKALQYMSLGIPALVSPVGVNTKIVDDGVNGYICNNNEDWYNNIEKLINNRNLLISLSAETRKKIENHYSVNSNKTNFINLFK